MSSTDTELRVLTVSHDLDDYDILATNNLSVAVPYKTTETLRKLIWAAMVAFGAEIAAGIEMRLVELARAPRPPRAGSHGRARSAGAGTCNRNPAHDQSWYSHPRRASRTSAFLGSPSPRRMRCSRGSRCASLDRMTCATRTSV